MARSESAPGAATTHRQRAIAELARNLAVTAGAGAGKTTVLVDRFVGIARDPQVGPEGVLAITFTRKAATEMKERAIRQFEAMGEQALRRRTEAAYISTIHGFAERVLRERAFDARIDPAFTVLTEYEQRLFLQEALRRMHANASLRAFAPRLGKRFEGGWKLWALVDEVARLVREGPAAARTEADAIADDDRMVELALARGRERARAAEQWMLEALAELRPLLERATFKSTGRMFAEAQEYLARATTCLAQDDIRGVDPAGWYATRFTGQIVEEDREPIKACLGRIRTLAEVALYDDWTREEALERELLPLKRAVYAAAADISRDYEAHKRAMGALDFHDLQRRAAALLGSHDGVRASYASRFRHILLDEAQDTDDLQYALIGSLRTGDNVLFMVGDPKQAIYEFRGANPDVFRAAIERLPADDRLQLAENFRSRAEIVSFVNGVGPALLGEEFHQIDAQGNYEGRVLDAPAVTAIWALQRALPGDGGRQRYEPVAAARPREAAAVAEEIVRLLREAPLVRDPESREPRWIPLRPRHVALLFRTRTAIPYFERALAGRGVPYVTAAGQGFYERAEVLDCLMVLRAVAQPLDDLAMAALLRSPFCGASDADLWRLRDPAAIRRGEAPPALWRALRDDAALAPFRGAFAALRRRSRGRVAADVLDDAIATFGYELALAAHEDGPAMLANLAKLRRQVRELGAISPFEAVAELERTRELLDREAMAPLVGEADDVVVLSTIHQAKGLEWPVVCLPNLERKANGKSADFSARHGVLLCAALDAEGNECVTFSTKGIREELTGRALDEERRLLYVALTRARERLVLSASVREEALHPKPGDGFESPLAFLLRHTEGTLSEPGEYDCGSYRTRVVHQAEDIVQRTPFVQGATLAASLAPAVVDAVAEEAVAVARPAPLSLKVTELLAYNRCPQVHRFSHVLEVEEHLPHRAATRGERRAEELSPVELGTIVHALLERARFDASDRAAEVERLLAGQPPARHAALRRMLEPVLGGEIGDAVRGARRVEREWPFAARVGSVLVEGIIDLAIQGPDGRWTVIDWKSNDLSRRGRFEHLVGYYAPQLELYAMSLDRAGIGAVAECALVFLTGPRVHRWAFDARRQRIGPWAEDVVGRIAAGVYETEAGAKCELCGYRKRKVCETGRGWTASS